jgi:hypothetical protein
MRVRRASATVALCLLTSAATAYAECAWVLWSEIIRGTGKAKIGYELSAAYTTQKECDAMLQRTAAAFKKKYAASSVIAQPNEVLIEDPLSQMRYFCLPDTVDPRGPKGK